MLKLLVAFYKKKSKENKQLYFPFFALTGLTSRGAPRHIKNDVHIYYVEKVVTTR